MSSYEPGLSQTANDVFDGIEGLGRWLGRVTTIALGTFLGIMLFVLVARAYVEDKIHETFSQITTPTTSTSTTPSYGWPR
jgi:hypothetical protein